MVVDSKYAVRFHTKAIYLLISGFQYLISSLYLYYLITLLSVCQFVSLSVSLSVAREG